MVSLHMDTYNGGSTTYQFFTQTMDKADELVAKLLDGTNASLIQSFKAIRPTVSEHSSELRGTVAFEFYQDKDKAVFLRFVSPRFFSADEFSAVESDKGVAFIAKQGGTDESQAARIGTILHWMRRMIADHTVEKRLNEQPEVRFKTDYREPIRGPEVGMSVQDAQAYSRGYEVDPEQVRMIHFSYDNRRSEIPVNDLREIVEWVNGPSKKAFEARLKGLDLLAAEFGEQGKAAMGPLFVLLNQIAAQPGEPTPQQVFEAEKLFVSLDPHLTALSREAQERIRKGMDEIYLAHAASAPAGPGAAAADAGAGAAGPSGAAPAAAADADAPDAGGPAAGGPAAGAPAADAGACAADPFDALA